MTKTKVFTMLLVLFTSFSFVQADTYQPEEGSAELDKKKKDKGKIDPNLPFVLILGDSISIGYTGHVKKAFKGKANVIHNPGNSQGTTHTLANIDKWLKMQKWDLIHFNIGLHDLKHVKVAGTSENSTSPDDPQQADIQQYEKNMKVIVAKLKASGAKLIFATTTPYPLVTNPYRDPKHAPAYNEVALKIMKENEIPVNDLYTAVLPKLKELQIPKNVHFKGSGKAFLGKLVIKSIEAELAK